MGGGSSSQDRFGEGGRVEGGEEEEEKGDKSAGGGKQEETGATENCLVFTLILLALWRSGARSLRPPADFIITPLLFFHSSAICSLMTRWHHPAIPAARFALIRLRPPVDSPRRFTEPVVWFFSGSSDIGFFFPCCY